jgi:hypothetical protein
MQAFLAAVRVSAGREQISPLRNPLNLRNRAYGVLNRRLFPKKIFPNWESDSAESDVSD